MSDAILRRLEEERAAIDPQALADRRGLGAGPATLGMARDVAAFCERHFAGGVVDGRALPGLNMANLPETTAVDLRCLVSELEKLGVALCGARAPFPRDEVQLVCRELFTFLDWLGRRDPTVKREVSDLRRSHVNVRTDGARISRLSQVRLLTQKHEARLAALPAFPPTLLEQAGTLVDAHGGGANGSKEAMQARKRGLVYLLRQRLAAVTEAAELAFRNHPDLLAEGRGARARRPVAAPRRKPAQQ